MTDQLGQQIQIGDKVAYVTHGRSSLWWSRGVVTKINKVMVSIHNSYGGTTTKMPDNIIKLLPGQK